MADLTGKDAVTLTEITAAIDAQIKRGRRMDDIVRQLLARGWTEERARQYVMRAAHARAELLGITPAEMEQRHVEARAGRLLALRGVVFTIACLMLAAMGLTLAQGIFGFILFAIGVTLGAGAVIVMLTGFNSWFNDRF